MSAPTLRLVEKRAQSPRNQGETPRATTRSKGVESAREARTPAPTERPTKRTRSTPQGRRALTAADVMSPAPVWCRATDSLNVAAQLLWEHDLGALVVVDDEGRPQSMLTDRDICFAAYTQGVPLWSTHVATAMSGKLTSCTTDTPIEVVRARLQESQVRRLPVVDRDGKLAGVIGLKDLAHEASQPVAKARKRGSSPAEILQLLSRVLEAPAQGRADAV